MLCNYPPPDEHLSCFPFCTLINILQHISCCICGQFSAATIPRNEIAGFWISPTLALADVSIWLSNMW